LKSLNKYPLVKMLKFQIGDYKFNLSDREIKLLESRLKGLKITIEDIKTFYNTDAISLYEAFKDSFK